MKLKFLTLAFLLSFAFSGMVACSDSGSDVSELDNPQKDDTAQDGKKGSEDAETKDRSFKVFSSMPGSNLTSVRVVELDSSLAETGRSYKIALNDSGLYEVESLALTGRYAIVRVDGLPLPLIPTGTGLYDSKMSVDLKILVDMDESKIPYITLAGHFVSARALNLVSQGIAPDSAVAQAEAEFYKVFAFSADSLFNETVLVVDPSADSWLAAKAFHRIFEQFAFVGSVTSALSAIETEFSTTGKLESLELFGYNADNLTLRTYADYKNGVYYYYDDVENVNEDIFVRQFYSKVYGLGTCDKESLCETVKNKKSESAYEDSLFICMKNGWLLADDVVLNTCGFEKAEDREVRAGSVDSTEKFYYNQVLGLWARCDSVQGEIGMCVPDRNGEDAFIKGMGYFMCTSKYWKPITADEYNLKDIDSVNCDTTEYRMGRDSVTIYICIDKTIRALTPEEQFAYENTKGVPCDTTPEFVLGNDSVTKYVCDAQVLRPADSLELLAGKGCNWYNYNDSALILNSYYLCRSKWKYNHEKLYRDTVVDARDGQSYALIGMGPQLWFAENLNYETENSWCYHDSTEYCDKYGRLYRSAEAASQKEDSLLCPKGFHVPTTDEFQDMFTFVQDNGPSNSSPSPILRSVDSHGSDYFGFHADLAGQRDSDGIFSGMGNTVRYCTSSKQGANAYYRWNLGTDLSFTKSTDSALKNCYVRCLADAK